MTQPNQALVESVLSGLSAAADPVRAAKQQQYMKSSLPYYGVSVPEVRRTAKTALREFPIQSRAQFEATISHLWDNVTHREQWYAALAIGAAPANRGYRDEESLPLFRHLIESGAWWDVVDDAATHLVGPLVIAANETAINDGHVKQLMREWATEHSLWLRRTAIICQVGGKTNVDTALLSDAIAANLSSKEFFLRKAIGWALRDLSRSDPQWVRSYVATHGNELSGLSIREATRHL